MYSVAFVVWWIITQWHLPLVDIWGGCKYWNWHFVLIWLLPLETSYVFFFGQFVNGRYHTACRCSGPIVWNSTSVTILKRHIEHIARGNPLLQLREWLFTIGGAGGEGGILTCPYPLKVQACPPRDQRPALRSRVLGQEGATTRDLLYAPSHR